MPVQQAELSCPPLLGAAWRLAAHKPAIANEPAIAHKRVRDPLGNLSQVCSELTPHVWRLKRINEQLWELLDILPLLRKKAWPD